MRQQNEFVDAFDSVSHAFPAGTVGTTDSHDCPRVCAGVKNIAAVTAARIVKQANKKRLLMYRSLKLQTPTARPRLNTNSRITRRTGIGLRTVSVGSAKSRPATAHQTATSSVPSIKNSPAFVQILKSGWLCTPVFETQLLLHLHVRTVYHRAFCTSSDSGPTCGYIHKFFM
jgi:hypothetical protein